MIRVLPLLPIYIYVHTEWCREIRLIFIFNCLHEHTSGEFPSIPGYLYHGFRLQPLPDKIVHRVIFEKTHQLRRPIFQKSAFLCFVPSFERHIDPKMILLLVKIHETKIRNPFTLVYIQIATSTSNERNTLEIVKSKNSEFVSSSIQSHFFIHPITMKTKTENRIVRRSRRSVSAQDESRRKKRSWM